MATGSHPDADLSEPLMLTAAQLARMLQVSTRTLWRMCSGGRLPNPLRIGGTVRWSLAEIKNWIAGGCPRVGPREN
jgi:prophage regulatory protein